MQPLKIRKYQILNYEAFRDHPSLNLAYLNIKHGEIFFAVILIIDVQMTREK